MKTIFAIGNPGKRYENTYHSIGHLYAKFLQTKFATLSIKETITHTEILTDQFILLISKVYMNVSAQALSAKIKKEDLIVIHDDLSVPLYKIKYKFAGSAGGHNGLKSIIGKIGYDFGRIRIGIDHPKNFNPNFSSNEDVSNYVLSKINETEKYFQAFEENFDFFKNLL